MFQKDIWDNLWKNNQYSDWDEGAQTVYEVLAKEIQSFQNKKILEAGSGTGRISLRLAMEGANTTLVDFSEVAIKQAKERFSTSNIDADFIVSDIMNMASIPDNTYDVVWNAGVLEHFDIAQQLQVLQEMKRILKPNGLLITINPNANCITYQIGKWFMERTERWAFGQELPIYTLQEVCKEAKIEFINEYSVGFRQSLDFLDAIPNSTNTRLAFETWYDALPIEKQQEVNGYLLVSICRKSNVDSQPLQNSPKDYITLREMNEKDTIIILSSIHFTEDLWQRPQQLAEQFTNKGYRVIYINNKSATVQTNEQSETISFCNYFLNAQKQNGISILDRIDYIEDSDQNKKFIQNEFLRQLAVFFGGGKTRVISYLPDFHTSLAQIKNQYNIEIYYECVDEITGFHSNKAILTKEKDFLKLVDGVIVTSKTLFVHKSRQNNKCILIPNAVNFDDFSQDFPCPADLYNLSGPIVGYVGAIANWFDQELVCKLAQNNPEWNIILVGTVYVNIDKMNNYNNIHILGRKEYSQIPAFMKHFDVGIIPFKTNDLIINTNPIKFFEYLAAGIDTIATPMPELIDEPYCHLAHSAEEFENIIQHLLKEKRQKDCNHYLQHHTWEKRIEDIISFINNIDTFESNRKQILNKFLHGYKKHEMPILKLLSAEIYHELNEIKQAQNIIEANLSELITYSPFIQLYLALEWNEIEYINAVLEQHESSKTLLDIWYWKKKGDTYLKIYALTKIGDIEQALSLAESLPIHDISVQEAIANFFYDQNQYIEACNLYMKVYLHYNKLHTWEGALKFISITQKLGHSTITAELSNLIINHETCLSNTFLDLYEGNHYQEAIHIGKECLQNQFISDSELADIHTLLAQCYQKNSMENLAVNHLKKALALVPNHHLAIDIINQLKP
ncbi:methyltransferase domain-containing protein [Bacillus cereus]|uniref:methyltransferase domain-containing protein n=1 Tax=Bacillus cereus TaxID=1396 RepID=UPI001145C118|nr:methyltransferase domain-containing protein [Bacillus cereus]